MRGKNELEVEFSVLTDFFRVCEYFHSFVYGRNAGSHKTARAFDFNKAETACADLVYTFEIAKCWNIDMCCTGSFENCRAGGNGNRYSVDFYINHVFHFSRSSFLTVYR